MTFLYVNYAAGSSHILTNTSCSCLTSKLWSLKKKSHCKYFYIYHILNSDVCYRPALYYALVTKMNKTKSLSLKNLKSSAKDKYKETHYVAIREVKDMIKML